MAKCHLKTLILRSGERLPLLVDDAGMPLHGPTLFSIAEIRNRHRASNTIANALAALSVLQQFLDENGIEISKRLEIGKLLELGEIEAIVRCCRIDFSPGSDSRVLVSSDVCATRIRTIRKYLEWLVKSKLLARDYRYAAELQRVAELAFNTISARIPPSSDSGEPKEGLSPEVVRRARCIINPHSTDNPWKSAHARFRNQVIWDVFLHLGMRGGELLGLRIQHIDLRRGVIRILRQPDCLDDPRRRQPNTKTLSRELQLSPILQQCITEYILEHRRARRNAHKHDFLFVSDAGDPLSCSALNKIFRVLRRKCPGLPKSLTPHSLRHTWNDMFSEEMDERKINSELEKRLRSYQMGWKTTSGSAAVYTRRFTRSKAQEVSLALQKQLMETVGQ